jgi:hypothetical protein
MNVLDLRLTQDGFRLNCEQFVEMLSFVESGGYYNAAALAAHNPKRTSLIAITEFEDGNRFIRDGMHRAATIYLAGRELRDDECFIEPMPYSDYVFANLQNGWYTPFDPRTHVRVPDFFAFKQSVQAMIDAGSDPSEYIERNRALYCVPRSAKHESIAAFAEELRTICLIGGQA